MDLRELGWNTAFNELFNKTGIDDLIPGRVTHLSGKHYKVLTQEGERIATVSNSLFKSIIHKSDFPSVGDWVGIRRIEGLQAYHIIYLFPRRNKLSRKVTGAKSEEQIIASNIDLVFIITSLDNDFNIRRLMRYLVMVSEIEAQPIIILNKIDACEDAHDCIEETRKTFQNVPIVAISAREGTNIDAVTSYLEVGKTIVLVGSSGVGKSTLINRIIGYSRQAVGEVREGDGKGRHITTSRELIVLPDGGMLIDNPGIRELQLWSSDQGIRKMFQDIIQLSAFCKFRDCGHVQEPGCAVKQAIERCEIPAERLHSYRKLMREHEFNRMKRNVYERKKQDRTLGKMYRLAEDIRRTKGKE